MICSCAASRIYSLVFVVTLVPFADTVHLHPFAGIFGASSPAVVVCYSVRETDFVSPNVDVDGSFAEVLEALSFW